MQVDNSGTTVVLDAKTTQAIEEGKNRITMLQVEELRLKNLKKGLEAEIISLEADIDYKEDKIVDLSNTLEQTEKECQMAQTRLTESITHRTVINDEIVKREEAVQAKETDLHEKQLVLEVEQAKLEHLIERTSRDWAEAEKAKDLAEDKIKKIDAFLKSL